MKKYVQITRYMAGDTIKKQVQDLLDKGVLDKDTRVFFANNNMLDTRDIREMLHWFEIGTDDDFNKENVVFIPKDWILKHGCLW